MNKEKIEYVKPGLEIDPEELLLSRPGEDFLEKQLVLFHDYAIRAGFWSDDTDSHFFLTKMALIAGEAHEAIEADRKDNDADPANLDKALALYRKFNDYGKPGSPKIRAADAEAHLLADFRVFFEKNVKDTRQDEIADLYIRLMDLVGEMLFGSVFGNKKMQFDIMKHVLVKHLYNKTRGYKHGKSY